MCFSKYKLESWPKMSGTVVSRHPLLQTSKQPAPLCAHPSPHCTTHRLVAHAEACARRVSRRPPENAVPGRCPWYWACVNTERTGCGQPRLKILAVQNPGPSLEGSTVCLLADLFTNAMTTPPPLYTQDPFPQPPTQHTNTHPPPPSHAC